MPQLNERVYVATKNALRRHIPGGINVKNPWIMGTSVDDIRWNWDLQRNYMWEIRLPMIGGLDGMVVAQFCQDLRFRDYSMGELSVMRFGAYQSKYAGFLDIPEVTMEFVRPINNTVERYFQAWRELIVDGTGFFSPKYRYAKNVDAYLLDTTNAAVARFMLSGVFPKEFPAYDLNYRDDRITTLPVTLSVDRVYPTFA